METVNSCTVYSALSAFIGIGAGYFIRFFLAKKSAKRKEDWEQLRDLNQYVNDLVDAAIAFFCSQDSEVQVRKKQAIHIQRMVSQAAQKVQAVARSLETPSLDGYLKRLRQSITQNDFDADISRPSLEITDEKIVAIEQACYSLVGATNLAFARLHRKSNF